MAPSSPSPSPRCHTGGFTATNSYLLEGPEGAILVDAAEGAAAWLRSLGVQPAALLLTHLHFDHVVDAARIAADFGCPVHAFSPFSREATLEALFEAHGMPLPPVTPFMVNHRVADGDLIEVAGLRIHALHVPGRSPDSLAFHVPEASLVFSGDTLMQGTIGRTDFPGGGFEMLVNAIRTRLLTLPAATRVFPGHGDPTGIDHEAPAFA